MNVLCSGSRYVGPIEDWRCTDCALNNENDCGYGYRLLKAIFATQEGESRRDEIHVTDITGCLKKAYLDKKRETAPYVHNMLYLFLGIAIHNALDIDDEHVESEVSVGSDGLVGRADAVFDDTLEDLKTTRWLNPSNLPYGAHEKQINIYNTFLRKDRLRLQYIDLSGPTKCRKCRVPVQMGLDGELTCPKCGVPPKNAHLGAVLFDVPNVDMDEYVDERVAKLSISIATGDEPGAEQSYLCSYCPHTDCEWNETK
jgi:hypothetical protein